MRLEAHNVQLKNIISKNVGVSNHEHKKKKQFDFSRYYWKEVYIDNVRNIPLFVGSVLDMFF